MSAEPYDASDLPTGLDRADGLKGRLGTASGPDQVAATSAGGSGVDNLPVEEFADSPTLIRAEKGTVEHRFRLPWNDAYTRMYGYHRGLVRTSSTDTDSERYFLLEARMQRDTGGRAIVTTVEEALDYDSPPDRFSVTPVELGLNIIKHPRYFYAFMGSGFGSSEELSNQMVIRLLQDYFENTTAAYRDSLTNLIRASIGHATPGGTQPPRAVSTDPETGLIDWGGQYVQGTDLAKYAALEIITKYWRGEEAPSVVGWQICWTEYFANPPYLNPGGYIENPITEGDLPSYFWSTVDTEDPDVDNNIFAEMFDVNPQCYADTGKRIDGETSISWRREADQLEWDFVWFAVHHRWSGSPYGHWDPDLYTKSDRPTTTAEFRQLSA